MASRFIPRVDGADEGGELVAVEVVPVQTRRFLRLRGRGVLRVLGAVGGQLAECEDGGAARDGRPDGYGAGEERGHV